MRALFELTIWNPVLRRELIAGLRSPRVRWVLILYLLVPFAAVAWYWPPNIDSGENFYGGSFLAKAVFHRFITVQLWLLALLTPVVAAYSVSSEFEQRTAELLWTSALPTWQIVVGKLLAVYLLCSLLLFVSLGALSAIFLL